MRAADGAGGWPAGRPSAGAAAAAAAAAAEEEEARPLQLPLALPQALPRACPCPCPCRAGLLQLHERWRGPLRRRQAGAEGAPGGWGMAGGRGDENFLPPQRGAWGGRGRGRGELTGPAAGTAAGTAAGPGGPRPVRRAGIGRALWRQRRWRRQAGADRGCAGGTSRACRAPGEAWLRLVPRR